MSGSGMRSVPMRKFCSERCVCAPQYLSAGTSIGPNVSVSVRVFAMIRPLSARHIITNARRFEDMSAEALELTPATERRPPAPQPRVGALGPIGLYRALRANAITAWRVEAYEEPYIADRNMLGGYVLLNDPDLIRTVLVEKVANYPKDALQLEKLTPAIGRGLLTAEPDSWRLQRRTVAPLFQPASVAGYLASMAASIDPMLARWEDHARSGAAVDIAREMTALTYDIISRTVFSHEIETPAEVMGEAITTYFEALGRIDLWDVLPLPRWLPRPAFIRARPAQGIFREEVRRLVERRRARIAAGGTLPDDLVTRLMQARDPETGAPLSDTVIHDNLVTFIGAGHETTANALAWTLFLLSEFPEADAVVAAEAVALGAAPDADDLERLTGTRMILEESMRLYPPVPFLSRGCGGARPDRRCGGDTGHACHHRAVGAAPAPQAVGGARPVPAGALRA